MALSDQQKAEIIYQFGYPGKTLIEGTTDYSKIIADCLNNLGTANEIIVIRLLNRAAKIDTALEEAVCRLAARRVGDIETNEYELENLRKEKLKILRELSDLLSLPLDRAGGGGIKVCV